MEIVNKYKIKDWVISQSLFYFLQVFRIYL
jgi:hypothetical protein